MGVAIFNTDLVLLFLLVHFKSVLQAIATGQTQTSGTAVLPKAIGAAPFIDRVKLDDAEFASRLPAGSAGTAAIYTDHVKPTHVGVA